MNAAPAPVLVDASGPAWRLTLNRPAQGNACSADLVRTLDEALARAEAEGAEVLVLQGAGRHFCTGFDLSKLDAETDDTLLARFVRIELLLQRIAHAPFLTVALAQGRTMGAGADLFAACAVRLAQADATFAFPGARGFGLVLGTRRLAARVGNQTALDWIASGASVAADEACRRRLVTSIVDGPNAIDPHRLALWREDGQLRATLRKVMDPHGADADALDLDLLVRSAARPGLRERVAAYLARVAAARRCPPSSPTRDA